MNVNYKYIFMIVIRIKNHKNTPIIQIQNKFTTSLVEEHSPNEHQNTHNRYIVNLRHDKNKMVSMLGSLADLK